MIIFPTAHQIGPSSVVSLGKI